MNYAVILSGGIGTRMRMEGFPKQYLEVNGKPILMYTLEVFSRCASVDRIVIVAADQWQGNISAWLKQYGIEKFHAFAPAGDSRQESILNGLNACMDENTADDDCVIIHDAVRPMVSDDLITRCFEALKEHDGCMPVLPVTDTVYHSDDGTRITKLLDRNVLFAGQAPESFHLKSYTLINRKATKQELAETKGTSVIAYQNGMDVCLIPGEDSNFKITTRADLERFNTMVVNNK